MALFAKKPKKSIPGREINTEDEILGYLDEVIKYRTSLTIRTKKDPFKLALYSIEEKEKLLKIQGDPGLDIYVDKPVQCGFPLDGTWFVFVSKVLLHENRHYLELPEQILRHERRKNSRARLSIRERVKVSALQGLGAGVGVTGFAVDVSTGGICLNIERAMILQQEREVPPSAQLLTRGTQLVIVKINRIPGVPPFETQGVVNRIFMEGGWKMAIQLPNIPPRIREQIKRFVQERAPLFSPVQHSRKRRLEMEAARQKEEEEKTGKSVQQTDEAALSAEETVQTAPGVECIGNTSGTEAEDEYNDTQLVPPPIDEPAPQEDIIAIEELSPAEVSTPVEGPVTGKSLISLGEILDSQLDFLAIESDYTWIPVDNPMKIVKYLNEKHPHYLLLPAVFNEKSMLDYLQRIEKMGVLKGVEIVLFTEGEIAGRELVKCRMLGIKHILRLPLESHAQLLDILVEEEKKRD
jgi:hypothetical protein